MGGIPVHAVLYLLFLVSIGIIAVIAYLVVKIIQWLRNKP